MVVLLECRDYAQASADARKYSLGVGAFNFCMTIPALFVIDLIGRRYLLLWTFPWMAALFLGAGLSYVGRQQEDHASAPVIVLLFLFVAVYSLGEGPVPLVCLGCNPRDGRAEILS